MKLSKSNEVTSFIFIDSAEHLEKGEEKGGVFCVTLSSKLRPNFNIPLI